MIHPPSEDNILDGFLETGLGIGAYSIHTTHESGIAVLPGMVDPFGGEKKCHQYIFGN